MKKFEKPLNTSHYRSTTMFQNLGFGLVLMALGWTVWGIVFLSLAGIGFLIEIFLSVARKITEEEVKD